MASNDVIDADASSTPDKNFLERFPYHPTIMACK
jgi:hypothetical protein